jgi:hypothetical protein
MSFTSVSSGLTEKHRETLAIVKSNAERLLNYTPRFRFFTLHGSNHLESLFEILSLLLDGGIELSEQELYLLSLALCIHDLGMVSQLRDLELEDILQGKPESADPAGVEDYIREIHHELVDRFVESHLDFLASSGLTPAEIGHVIDISRCHRKVVLETQSGFIQYLGALLRIVDELDLSAKRAPVDVLRNHYQAMDATSCWHWFKHNIVEPWHINQTVSYSLVDGRKAITFRVGVRPTDERTIDYWLSQTIDPLVRVVRDEGAGQIVKEKFGVNINVEPADELCRVNKLDSVWSEIEKKSLSSSLPVILAVDDQFGKLEDLFLPLMRKFRVMSSDSAKDALIKLRATDVKLVIIDMQMGSGGMWNASETSDYKFTGQKLCEEIRANWPEVRIGILTGTRYSLPPLEYLKLAFLLRKPVDPDLFVKKVTDVLS